MIWRFIFTHILRWQALGDFPDISKSIIVVAPHTSYWDAIIGVFYLKSKGVPFRLLVHQKFFFFPLTLILRIVGGIPVCGHAKNNAIRVSTKLLLEHEKMHVVICPEGAFAPKSRWHDGFYLMAQKAHVPIIVGYLDYKKKQAGTKCVIDSSNDLDSIYGTFRTAYQDVAARYPDRFILPEYSTCKKLP